MNSACPAKASARWRSSSASSSGPLVFLFHSWVSNHPGYDAIADEIWNLQKFLVTIGMLLVLLEQQVSTNEWHAFHDHLTGLPNHRLFDDRLTAAIQQSLLNKTRTALLMVDLDGFKLINDSHGHEVGDELLRHIGHNLRSAIRAPDTLARLGGDEFIIIATDLPSDQPVNIIADTSATRIARALRKPVSINGQTIRSPGASVLPSIQTTPPTKHTFAGSPTSVCTRKSARPPSTSKSSKKQFFILTFLPLLHLSQYVILNRRYLHGARHANHRLRYDMQRTRSGPLRSRFGNSISHPEFERTVAETISAAIKRVDLDDDDDEDEEDDEDVFDEEGEEQGEFEDEETTKRMTKTKRMTMKMRTTRREKMMGLSPYPSSGVGPAEKKRYCCS